MGKQSFDEASRAGMVLGVHGDVSVDERTDEPCPGGALMVSRIARAQVAEITRLVRGVFRRE